MASTAAVGAPGKRAWSVGATAVLCGRQQGRRPSCRYQWAFSLANVYLGERFGLCVDILNVGGTENYAQ